jgi:hypothetical protein
MSKLRPNRNFDSAFMQTPLWLRSFFVLLMAAYAFLFIRRPTPFFADDSFFYLQVGRNFALGHGSTFNGLMPTNGYHPLWMLLCAAVYRIFPGRIAGLHGIAVLIVVLNIVVLLLAAYLLRKLHAPAWVAWTILIPFLFGLQLGTESSLSAAFLAATLIALFSFFQQPGWRAGLAYNLLAALAVLSRLDSIFIIAALWIAVLIWSLRERQRQPLALRVHLGWIPLYAILWGAYLASNLIWFHILMPISGLLKSSNGGDHRFGHNLPHTALLSLAICAVSILILWRKKNDRWFQFAELPFFIGILIHGAYITLRMTGETRWTWYYTSWALLAALTVSRAVAACFMPEEKIREGRRPSALYFIAIGFAVLVSAAVFYKWGWQHSRMRIAEDSAVSAMDRAVEQHGIHRLLAYDQPGGMAYFTNLAVVPLDGLMADRAFQTELAQRGVGEFVQRDQITGFAGPAVPLGQWGHDTYCGKLFLESTKYTCEPWTRGPDGAPQWMITGVEVYSRIPLEPAGYIPLAPGNILWTDKNYLSVWRIADNTAAKTAESGAKNQPLH